MQDIDFELHITKEGIRFTGTEKDMFGVIAIVGALSREMGISLDKVAEYIAVGNVIGMPGNGIKMCIPKIKRKDKSNEQTTG